MRRIDNRHEWSGKRGFTLEERFWRYVEKQPGGCWIWTARINEKGYGHFMINSTSPAKAHRISYQIHFGPIPDGMLVLHKCDNKACVNPSHLYLGTHHDNMNDIACGNKRRSLHGKPISEQKIAEMRLMHLLAGAQPEEIAKVYCVSLDVAKRAIGVAA